MASTRLRAQGLALLLAQPSAFSQGQVFGALASEQPAAIGWKCRMAWLAVVSALGPGAPFGQVSSFPHHTFSIAV